MSRPHFAGRLAGCICVCFAGLLSALPLAAETETAPESLELIVLLPEGGDPVTVAEAINSPSPLRPIPYGLETGNPVGAKILIEERPEGATLQWVLANPDRPLSRLYRYLVLTYPQATDIGGVRAALQGIGEVQHVEPNYTLELHVLNDN